MKLNDMTPELAEQATKCDTPEEFLAFAAENGIELSDNQMDAITGGGGQYIQHTPVLYCPNGESINISPQSWETCAARSAA